MVLIGRFPSEVRYSHEKTNTCVLSIKYNIYRKN